MTKDELIKALQDDPHPGHAKVYIFHRGDEDTYEHLSEILWVDRAGIWNETTVVLEFDS